MLNSIRFWFVLVVVFFVALFARQATAQVTPCPTSTESDAAIKQREQRILQIKLQFVNASISATPTYIPVKAHIIRKSDGTGGLSLADLNKAIAQTNVQFINAGIQFYICGSGPNYINNTTYYDFNSDQESALCSANDVNNAINLYFPNSISFSGFSVAGYAYFPSSVSITNRAFIQASTATDSRTMPHEMGHYFNLLHTFQGSASSNQTDRELVTRLTTSNANCTIKGDLLCDTPSDPYGRPTDSTQIIGCNYSGNARDVQNQLYVPQLGNIMSYYPITCGNSFSSGQYARMADGLLLRLDASNQYTLNCSATVSGANVPSGLTGSIGNSGITLNFADNSTNESGFIIERSTTSPTDGFLSIAGVAPNVTTYIDQSITAFTTYYYRVKASNSSSQYSPVFQIATSLSYCKPLYTNSCSSVGVLIDDFVLQEGSTNIIRNINSDCSVDNYGDFTNTLYNVEAGKTYTFIARAVSGGVGTFFDQHITIWIDYNKNGIFDASEIVYQSDGGASPRMNPTATGTFTVPNTASGGLRLRIRTGFGSFGQVTDPCATLSFGEAEDYSLNVITTATISAGTVSPTMACAGQPISVAFSSNILPGTGTYQVQLSDASGSNFTNIPTFGTGSPLSATIPVGTTAGSGYRVKILSTNPNGESPISPTFSINPVPSPPTVTNPVNYTQNQSASALTATGSNLSWYVAASGGSGSSTAPTPPTSTIGSTNYYVSQSVLNCESPRATIQVNVTAITYTISTPTVSPTVVCAGQTISVAFSTNIPSGTGTYQVQLSDESGSNFANIPTVGTGSPLSATIPVGTTTGSGYRVKIVSTSPNVSSSSSAVFSINAIPSPPTVTTPVNYTQNQSASALTATGSNLSWYATASGGSGSSTAPTPPTSTIGSTNYYVSQSVSNCESARATIQVNVTANNASITACLNIKMLMEGPYLGSGQMSTDLNSQGLLPGQTIVDPFASGPSTPAGQPFNVAPWNYSGTETVTQPYNVNVVDWVLVSLRTNPEDKTTTVYRTAALLYKDGTITTIAPCPSLSPSQQYYVGVDHRNHVGAVSHILISIVNNQISYDFRLQESYTPPSGFGYGQKQIGSLYLLYAGDCQKTSVQVIDVSDNNKWRQNNGYFSTYIPTDMNMDGAIDTVDRLLWRKNNGKFSGVDF